MGRKLEKFKQYSRKEVQEILAPEDKFKKSTGTWGMQGIVSISKTKSDYVFFVTYGRSQSGHNFIEGIDENGVFNWQSQPSNKLKDPRIIKLIHHDYLENTIYLFLRTNFYTDYTYLGTLAYIEHDNQREKPVYFKWQLLDWDPEKTKQALPDLDIKPNFFIEQIKENTIVPKLILEETSYVPIQRKGKTTQDFLHSRQMDFIEEDKRDPKLAEKGEAAVVEYEKARLYGLGKKELAQRVVATRNTIGDTAEFNVLSYEEDGTKRYIEVRTTKGQEHQGVFLSHRKVQFSQKFSQQFYLYRVYEFNPNNKSGKLTIQKGAVDLKKLRPIEYLYYI